MAELDDESDPAQIRERLDELNRDRARLEGRLTQLARVRKVSPVPIATVGPITTASPPAQKVALFKRLFNVVVPKKLVEPNAIVVKQAQFILVRGRVQREGVAISVQGAAFKKLRSGELAHASRDFH